LWFKGEWPSNYAATGTGASSRLIASACVGMVLSERVTKSNVKIHPFVHQGMAAMADRPDVKQPCGPEIISLLTLDSIWLDLGNLDSAGGQQT
jgi:hypothetical protein